MEYSKRDKATWPKIKYYDKVCIQLTGIPQLDLYKEIIYPVNLLKFTD